MAEVEVCYLEAGGGGGCRSRREAAEVVAAALFPLATLQHQANAREGGSGGMMRAPGRFFLSWSEFPRGRSGEN